MSEIKVCEACANTGWYGQRQRCDQCGIGKAQAPIAIILMRKYDREIHALHARVAELEAELAEIRCTLRMANGCDLPMSNLALAESVVEIARQADRYGRDIAGE